MLLLPKSVLKRMVQICRAFLWEGKVFLTKSPPLAWEWVCRPKIYGGIGTHDYLTRNTTAIGKYIWQVSQKEDVIWIKWVHGVYIKGANWWEYKAPTAAS